MGGGEMTNCNKNVILNKYLEKILNIFSSDHCWDDCYAVNLIPLNNDEENFCIMQPWFFFFLYIWCIICISNNNYNNREMQLMMKTKIKKKLYIVSRDDGESLNDITTQSLFDI